MFNLNSKCWNESGRPKHLLFQVNELENSASHSTNIGPNASKPSAQPPNGYLIVAEENHFNLNEYDRNGLSCRPEISGGRRWNFFFFFLLGLLGPQQVQWS